MTDTTNTIETAEVAPSTVLQLDPAQLLEGAASNVRDDIGDITALTASVKELGVIEPVVIAPNPDGGWHLIAGSRRCHAAVAAGRPTVPAVVRTDLVDANQLVAGIAENLHRKALTAGEEATAYQQLAVDFGLTPTAIAKRTGTKTTRVKDAMKVADSPKAVAAASRFDLRLEHALVLAEFDDDNDAIKTLTVTAKKEPERFDHVAARLRRDRQDHAERQQVLDELAAKAITVVEVPSWDAKTKMRRLDELVDDKDRKLTPGRHARCPGHVATVARKSWESYYRAEYWCADPTAHGHRVRNTSSGGVVARGGTMTEEEKAERRTVIENNKAWVAATDVRLAHVRDLLAGRKGSADTLRWATTEILARPDALSHATEAMLADLLGDTNTYKGWGHHVGPAAVDGCVETRLPLLLAAQVVASLEATAGKHTWRHTNEAMARYFTWLAGNGYVLADIEQLVIDKANTATGTDSLDTPATNPNSPTAGDEGEPNHHDDGEDVQD